MKNSILTIILTILIMAIITLAAVAAVANTGFINVAASADYVPGAEWFFGTLSRSSIERHTQNALDEGRMTPPKEITDSMMQSGQHHFVEMCVVCHGAPGVERGEIGKGQKPSPPELSRVAQNMSMAEIYWVVQHGIRHTGMPAFGETHSEDELWAIAAFVERLESMSPEEYEGITESQGEEQPQSGGHDHSGHTH